MSNRGEFVGTAPTSGNYIPAPTPAEQEDLPVYVNDELLRLGGVVNGVLEGGSLPPHSKLPKRFKEGMIMNFSKDVGGGVDSSGVWLYKNAKWWKLIDDPTTITDEIYEEIGKIEDELDLVDEELIKLNADLDNLNDVELPALQANLDNLNNVELPAVQDELTRVEGELTTLNDTIIPSINDDLSQLDTDLSTLDGKFPIGTTDISDDAISTPKLQANSVHADKIIANAISADKIAANAVTTDKLKALSVTADKIVANAITADKIAANTITGDKIRANTINGDRIIANTINGDRIIANTISGDKLLVNSIGADKIIANSITGGKISSATTIRAGSGNQSASLDGADNTWRLYAGDAVPNNAPFRVDKDGNLFAASGTFGGAIKAEKLQGDVSDYSVKECPLTVSSRGTLKDLAQFNILPQPFERFLVIGGIMANSFDTGNEVSSDTYIYLYLSSQTSPLDSTFINTSLLKVGISKDIMCAIPANTTLQATVKASGSDGRADVNIYRQNILASIFKTGSTIS